MSDTPWYEGWVISQLVTGDIPADIEAEVEELTEWLEWLKKLAAQADVIKARLDKQRRERQETEARILEIVERQRAEVERELEERRLERFQRKIAWLKKRIDEVCDKIIHQMRERRRQIEIQAAAEARKAAEDLQVWETFKRQILDLSPPRKPANTTPDQHARPVPVSEAAQPLHHEDLAVWEAFKRDLTGPKKPIKKNGDELARKQAEEDRLLREFEVYQAKQAVSPEENQAAWNDFARRVNRKK
jgi:hypothetical protein